MKNDFKIITFIFCIIALCSFMYLNKTKNISSHKNQRKTNNTTPKSQKVVSKDKLSSKNIMKEQQRKPAQRSPSTTTTLPFDQSQEISITPTLAEQKVTYKLDEANKLELLELNFYVSGNSKVFRGDVKDFDHTIGTITSSRQGYVEYIVNPSSKYQSQFDLPVVVNQDNAQSGYLSGEIVMTLSKYKKNIEGIIIERERKSRDLINLKASNMKQINTLIKEYGNDPLFYLHVTYRENQPN